MFFRSERLFLRPGWPEDWTELFGQIADPATDAQAFANKAQGRRHPCFLITLPTGEGARLIGCVGLAPDAEGTGEGPELCCWIAPGYRGRGFAAEACRAVAGLARTLGHRRLQAALFADDHDSAHMLRTLGFLPTGRTVPRFLPAEGRDSPAAIHRLELGVASACDGGDPDGAMRAA